MKRRLALVARRVEGLSGASRMIVEHARRFVAAGWEVHVFAGRLDAPAVTGAGATPNLVLSWPWGSWLKRVSFARMAARGARGFDLVHGHGDLFDQDVLSLHNCVHAAHEAVRGTPLPDSDATGRLHSRQLRERRFRVLVANSRLMKDDATRRFGVPPESVEVVYPGFDPSRFTPADRERLGAPMRAELGVTPGETLVGLVTSGDFEKRGLPAFLRAFALAARTRPGLRALVVGKETRPGPYKALAAGLGVAERVIWREPSAGVERFYHALDLYAHPARWEEFGMSVLEALACGLPVVTGSKVGAAELMTGGLSAGVLADPAPEPLAAAFGALADDADRRRALGALGPAAAAPCAWDASAARLLALYERLLPPR
ncbi:MAG: glycosyltransferase family 4 protein [Elusimicrobiota bacterium]|nr:glycosyltransferase family 4 protein [Elusimicrobiota bacterium]